MLWAQTGLTNDYSNTKNSKVSYNKDYIPSTDERTLYYRYKLLLNDLLKYTRTTHTDYERLSGKLLKPITNQLGE